MNLCFMIMFIVIRYRWTELQFIYILFRLLYLWLTPVAIQLCFFVVVNHNSFSDETAHLWELCILFMWQCHQSVECKFNGLDLHIGIIIMPFIAAVYSRRSHTGISISIVWAYHQPYSFNNPRQTFISHFNLDRIVLDQWGLIFHCVFVQWWMFCENLWNEMTVFDSGCTLHTWLSKLYFIRLKIIYLSKM